MKPDEARVFLGRCLFFSCAGKREERRREEGEFGLRREVEAWRVEGLVEEEEGRGGRTRMLI